MSEESKSIDVLEAQITATAETHKHLAGLIEKATRVQVELMSAGFDEFSNAISEPFSAMSTAAEKLQELVHRLEIERNRIRNET